MRTPPGLLALFFATGCDPLAVQRNPDSNPTSDTAGNDDTGTPPAIDADGDGYTVDEDCDDTDSLVGPATTWYFDGDGDGWGIEYGIQYSCDQLDGYTNQYGDCDDDNVTVNPEAEEICDGLDNDCNNVVDDSSTNAWYLDYDNDGYGDVAYEYTDGCDGETYLVTNADDCDDNDPAVNPGADEVCNSIDDDCDGSIDPSTSVDAGAWFADEDGDNYGDVDEYEVACEAPEGFVGDWSDCNDANPVMNPGQTEICDEIDNDCDLEIDESDGNPDAQTLWDDDDADGFGDDDAGSFVACPADGFVEQGGDCDDTDSAISPDADEICDGLDNDCDGSTDPNSSVDASTWYTDSDADGFGDNASSVVACDLPEGAVEDASDCDDTESDVNPGATEVCNDIDDDCDGTTDVGAADASTWYPDIDGDAFGNASGVPVIQCDQPSGYVSDSTDCDDTDAWTSPGAIEECDGIDQDCDGTVDNGAIGNATWRDADEDGYGYGGVPSLDCVPPEGNVANNDDCDDTDSSVFPGATEYCDTQDNDCDGAIDEDVGSIFYADTDSDGYGDVGSPADACSVSSGYSPNADDCDDTDGSVNPDATEVCDGADNDCDGSIDSDSSADASTWYGDTDGDGWGDASASSVSCAAPSGSVSDDSDCDDSNAAINPGTIEICDGSGVDENCNGLVNDDDPSEVPVFDVYKDADGDGFGDPEVTIKVCSSPDASWIGEHTDCDDTDSSVFPGATEVCNDVDDDCDGTLDEGVLVTLYADSDGDGYGDPSSLTGACEAFEGWVEDETDCDDTDENVNPDAIEICGDSVDNDCDEDVDNSPCVTEGDYSGNFSITLTETTYGLGSDSCEGTASLTVDTTADSMISGTVECEFVGDAATYLGGTYSGDVEGDFDEDLVPFGYVEFTTFGWSFKWDDAGSGDTNVDGDFEGSDTYEVYGIPLDFDYTGGFATDVVP